MTNDTIDKIVWEMIDFTKETTKKNFVTAVNEGQLKLNPEILPTILTLIDSSIKEGYNKNYKSFFSRMEKLNEVDTTTSKKRK